MDTLTTQRMPTRDQLRRNAEATQAWAVGKVADFNARRTLERRTAPRDYVQGWRLVEAT